MFFLSTLILHFHGIKEIGFTIMLYEKIINELHDKILW